MYAVFAGFVVILLMPCWRGSLASWCTLCLQVCSGKLVYTVFTGLFWQVGIHCVYRSVLAGGGPLATGCMSWTEVCFWLMEN